MNQYELICIKVLGKGLKQYVPIAFSSHRAQLQVVFLVSNKSPYFIHYNPKFQLQMHYSLAVKAEKVPISSIPILIVLCFSITTRSPVLHSYFCPRRENKKQP